MDLSNSNISFSWSVDSVEKTVTLDDALASALELANAKLEDTIFLGYVIPKDREAIGAALASLPEKRSFDYTFGLEIGHSCYRIKGELTRMHTLDNAFVSAEGTIDILTMNVGEQSLEIALQVRNIEAVLREQQQRITMACRVSMIYPWTWYIEERSAEFTVTENGEIVKKGVYYDGFAGSIHPDDRKFYYENLGAFVQGKHNSFFAIYRSNFFTRGEEYRWYEMVGEVFESNDHGKCTRAVGVLKDVTDSKDKEALLIREKENAERVLRERKMVLDHLSTGLVYIDRNYIVRWESIKALGKIVRNYPYSLGEVCYKSVFRRDTPCEECPLLNMFETAQKSVGVHCGEDYKIEITANPVIDEQNEMIGGVLKLEDITERSKKEEELLRVKKMLEFALEGAGTVAWEINPKTRIFFANTLNIIGYESEVPLEGYIEEYIHPDFSEYVTKEMEKLITGQQQALDVTVRGLTSLSSKRKMEWINLKGKAISLGANGEFGIFGTVCTVTDRVERETELIRLHKKAEESNALKSAFLANISHEIRTPLNAIVGFSELLALTDDVAEKQEYIGFIKRNNGLLLQLISDVLDVSKIEAGILELTHELVDVNELCRNIVAVENFGAEAEVPVIFENDLTECFVYSDRNRLIQVLQNLITNAIKFTAQGDIRIGYELKDEGGAIEFYVKDTGVGISPEDCLRIFDRFFKLDTFAQGAGLGLPICKTIIGQLGGTIGVESELGKGSRFWFVLPRWADRPKPEELN